MKRLLFILFLFPLFLQGQGLLFLSTIKPTQAPSTSSTDIDDNVLGSGNNQVTYVGTWGFGNDPTAQANNYLGTIHYSNATDAYALINFNGYGIDVISETFTNQGIAGFSIDGGTETTFDEYSATHVFGVTMYHNVSLTNGPHTLKVRVTGTKNASATNTFLVIDQFRVYINSSTPSPPVIGTGTIFVDKSGSDSNTGTQASPFLTIGKAASVSNPGDIVNIGAGTYRETISITRSGTAGAPITFQAATGATVIISGLDTFTPSWTVHSGQVYKTTITLPVANFYNSTITSNTTLLANQIFRNGEPMVEARWPNITSYTDFMDLTKWRHISQTSGGNSLGGTVTTDSGIPAGLTVGGSNSAKFIDLGWFWKFCRDINTQPTNQVTYSDIQSGNYRFRKYFYVTNSLNLLDNAKEWYYASNTLYFKDPGLSTPTGTWEYKVRNWGFDFSSDSYIVLKNLDFIGCEPATGNTATNNCTLDGVDAIYQNHAVMFADVYPGYGNAEQTGVKLIGANNKVINSRFRWAASQAVWLGDNGLADNNYFRNIGYEASWGSGVNCWRTTNTHTITHNYMAGMSRSAIDMSPSYNGNSTPFAQNLNNEIAYNDFTDYMKMLVDGGAIYSWGFRDLTGTVIHHNWAHHSGVVRDPTGIPLDGIVTSLMYHDQGSGPATWHHNITWGNFEGTHVVGMSTAPDFPADASEMYNQSQFEIRNAGKSLLYNNLHWSNSPMTYTTYVDFTGHTGDKDVMRNDIFRNAINMFHGTSNPPDVQYSRIQSGGSGSGNTGVITTTPQFVGTSTGYTIQDGRYFMPTSISPARNAGTPITNITTGYLESAPDLGPYEYGDPNPWVAGCSGPLCNDNP